MLTNSSRFTTYVSQINNIKFDATFLPVVATSFTIFMVLYKFANPFFSNLLVKSYKNFTITQKIDFSTRINSSINSFTVGTICVYMMIADRGLEANPLLYKSYLLKTNLAIVIGYLFADTAISIIHYKKVGDPFTITHHLVSIYAFFYVLTLDVMPYFANFRLLAELSTPFVNIRWFLDTLKFSRTSTPFVANGLIMTLLFFFVRIVAMPIYWYKVYVVAIQPMWAHMGHFRFILISVCIVLDVINIYWFSKMLRGCIKILQAVFAIKQSQIRTSNSNTSTQQNSNLRTTVHNKQP
ncbi:unnamed protein product [Didymodactylos carnosus]|uniref:TLC domain-containing protein n=1 Tax=Didymodactylos carnosus TaxID=1234261 RepID=A0A813P6E3_9BILA|nr:unnamed protein product [Didymodactylos carnosus]CAF0955526.1 unnamed protein product [Didymodactylos carnosus]CAF3524446.1 unnamed protein product [Didymodactylos carnosus]CAF3728847.1 unnamed protein product [Didymodactylos carnosus]